MTDDNKRNILCPHTQECLAKHFFLARILKRINDLEVCPSDLRMEVFDILV